MFHSMKFHQLIKRISLEKYSIINLKRFDHHHHQSCSSSKSPYHSSLYVSSRYGQEIFQVIRPRYDSYYLEQLDKRLEQLFEKRSIKNDNYGDLNEMKKLLKQFLQCLEQTESLKKKKNRLILKFKKNKSSTAADNEKYQNVSNDFNKSREQLFALEEKVIPFLLNIPNDIESSIGTELKIIDQCKSIGDDDSPSHNYVRLGYINNLYQRSIVGPNANYLQNQGTLLYYGLIDMFCSDLDQNNFIPINGLDLVKSAIVEAINSRQFSTDPFMLNLASGQTEENQRLHLVGEASLESLCAFLIKHPQLIDRKNKFYQTGSTYESDQLKQNHIIRATIITNEELSQKIMKHLYELCWNFLSKIGLQRLSLRSDIKSLYHNEYDKYFLMAWLKNSQEWIKIGEICNYNHFISQRLGFNDYQNRFILSSTIDLIPLIYSIVEQFQIFETGKLKLPPELVKNFM